MANITTELQNAVDNIGYYTLPAGTSSLSSTILLEGKIPFWLKGQATSVLEWTGTTGSKMFEFVKDTGVTDYNTEKILFSHVEAVSEVDGVSFIRVRDHERPNALTMENCTLTTIGAYAIDFDDCEFTVTCHFENMRTYGSGAARLRSDTGGVEGYWFSSLMEIKNWVHEGSNRVGPAFDFLGCRGLKLLNIWDKGDPSLLTALRGNWAAPVSLRMNAPSFPCNIENYIVEYDTDFTNAPGCYLHEFRTDSSYAVGKTEMVNVVGMTMHDYNIDTGVAHVRFMGGNASSTSHGLLVTLDACEDLDGDKMLAGGKVLVRAKNIWYNPGESAKATSMQAFVEAMDSSTWSTPIMTATDRPPRETITTPLYVSGTDLYDDYEADVGDYETILESL